ncbi:hypothetical protein NKJ28_00300 [Mesorhizobium sp. M0145]|uniref:hypothetical protein n=1 Tax=Mesorhizobium sp. M0145 TaxID=2956895 RepID=UPI003337503E
MTVADLIAQLQQMPQDAQVVVFNGDVHAPSMCAGAKLMWANMSQKFPEFSDGSKPGDKQVVLAR